MRTRKYPTNKLNPYFFTRTLWIQVIDAAGKKGAESKIHIRRIETRETTFARTINQARKQVEVRKIN